MENKKLVFGKLNYIVMIAGIILLVLGAIIMTMDKEAYGLGSLGITVGPMLILAGFVVEVIAIFIKSGDKE